MKYNLAFKYRIYPNRDQELLINKTFGCIRFVYNTILYTANKFYEETGKAALEEFSQSAKSVLERRVKNSGAKNEQRWLRGWLNRCETYNN